MCSAYVLTHLTYRCPTFVDLLVYDLYVSSAIIDEQRHYNFWSCTRALDI